MSPPTRPPPTALPRTLPAAWRYIRALERSPFGCPNRRAGDRLFRTRSPVLDTLLYFDLENLHALNRAYGEAVLDRAITRALRLGGGVQIVQVAGGDEFMVWCPESDAAGIQARLVRQLAAQTPPLAAVFATIPLAGLRLAAAVAAGSACVRAAKNARDAARGGGR